MSGTILTTDQKDAYDAFFRFLIDDSSKHFVLSGYSGTGKTTLVQKILDDMDSRIKTYQLLDPSIKKWTCVLTATTNKAAENLSKIVGGEASTIHSLLGIKVYNNFSTNQSKIFIPKDKAPVHGELIFIDEASYIDEQLLRMINKATPGCKLVFIGDPAQLLTVGCTKSPVFDAGYPEAKLTEIVRQAKGNPIQDLSNKFRDTVNTGQFFSFEPDGFHIRHLGNKDDFENEVLTEFCRPDWNQADSKVLAWTNKTVIGFNNGIVNQRTGNPELKIGDYAVVNNYVNNGRKSLKTDQQVCVTRKHAMQKFGVPGYLMEVDGTYAEFMPKDWTVANNRKAKAVKEEDIDIAHQISNWLDLRAAYSCTINKSQGSTYDRVFIDLDDLKKCRDGNQLARLLYVGISRAREEVILTGDLV